MRLACAIASLYLPAGKITAVKRAYRSRLDDVVRIGVVHESGIHRDMPLQALKLTKGEMEAVLSITGITDHLSFLTVKHTSRNGEVLYTIKDDVALERLGDVSRCI